MQVMAAAGESGEMKGWKEPSRGEDGRRGTTCERLKGIRKREEKKAKKATARNMHEYDVTVRKRGEPAQRCP